MANWFTRLVDRVTPWDRGGEVQRRQEAAERRRREEEERARQAAQAPRSAAPQIEQRAGAGPLSVQQPTNVFETLNKNLVFNKPQNLGVVSVNKPVQPPKPNPEQLRQAAVAANAKVRENTASDMSFWTKLKRFGAPAAGTTVRDTAVDIARAPFRATASALQTVRAPGGYSNRIDPANMKGPSGAVARFIYGKDPIGTVSDYPRSKVGEKKNWYDAPLGAAMVALDTGLPIVKGFKVAQSRLSKGLGRVGRVEAPAIKPTRPTQITVRKNIPIDEVVEDGLDVPVRVMPSKPPKTGRVIRELSDDAKKVTPDSVARQRADDAQLNALRKASDEAPAARPDRSVEGITPRNPGDPALVTRKEINQEYADLDEALANKEIGVRQHKEAKKALDALVAVDDAPKGKPIQVKEAKGIDVIDQTVVPQNLPETPGRVRVTESTAPSNAKSQAVAAQTPAPIITKETLAILDNPKKFTKRQVAAARNQVKLAKKMAKAQEESAAALNRIETASPAAQSGEGFVPTGEFGKSVNGGPIQKVSRRAEMAQAVEETSQMSPADVLQTARKNQGETGGFNRRDIRNIAALFEQKRIVRGTPEWNEARTILKEDGTIWGQTGALRNYTMRRTATATELINRFESKIYRLADDPTKVDGKLFDDVEAAEEVYTQARDDAMAAYNRFTESPTSANAKAYHAAQDAAEQADKAARVTEYKVAEKVLKGNKDVEQARALEKMANDADLYQMDAVDASMLSGTGTFTRNFVNALVGGAEESLFGGLGSRISRVLTGQNVGGGIGKGSASGFKEGAKNVVDVSKARADNAGRNPFTHIKNWATTGNQLGDAVIDGQVKHNLLDHYKQILKDQGYVGRELNDRASVMARQDPDDLGRVYTNAARTAAGLGGGITRNNKIETIVRDMISNTISMGKPTQATETAAKLITRMTIGFPTAIGRSVGEGVKRFTLGAPTFIKALRTSDPVARAVLVKEGIKQAGTGGLVIPPLFYAMGASGMITGAYPEDKEERARWEREGITENSVKIGNDYYQLPAYLGSWSVPGLFYASLGRNDGDWGKAAVEATKIVPSILPVDQMSNWMDVINGRSDFGKFMTQTGASAVRAATPGGALLNQISKSLDPTKNDTSSGSHWENFVDKVAGGIPGVNNAAGIPDKTDDAGNVIANPDPLALLFGAASTGQRAGEERSAEIQSSVNSNVQKMADIGVLNDPNLQGVLDDAELKILNDLKAGKELGEGELEKLQDAFVKGVSQTGDDTAYLEREQYDTNLAALRLKRERMVADKTVKPSDIKKIDTAITRGEVYRDNEIPYDLISDYQSIGVEAWRKMGDPDSDDYDPDMYQMLYDVDQMMAKAGVSYKTGNLKNPKYFLREKGSGRGGGGARSLDASFGTLKSGTFAPALRQYEGLDVKAGGIPSIRVVRPNIVHKITSSG